MRTSKRIGVIGVSITLLLAACGFKPSNVVSMAAIDAPFTVNAKNPYSPLADNIERALSASGVALRLGSPRFFASAAMVGTMSAWSTLYSLICL